MKRLSDEEKASLQAKIEQSQTENVRGGVENVSNLKGIPTLKKEGTDKRSYLAMVLSIVIPGLGQFYLRKPFEGTILFIGVVFATGLIYLHSLPVNDWRDLTRIEPLEKWWRTQQAQHEEIVDSDNATPYLEVSQRKRSNLILLYQFNNGKKLMYRTTWHFKASGLIQGLVCWMYAIYGGLQGQRGFNKRAFKRKLKEIQNDAKQKKYVM